VYNTTANSATGFTPFELLFARFSTLPYAYKRPPGPQYNYDDYISELRNRLQTVHQHAHKNLIASKRKSKEHYDRTSVEIKLQVGDEVLLSDETVGRSKSRKLSSQRIKPKYAGKIRINIKYSIKRLL
jgi:hypothetical protein